MTTHLGVSAGLGAFCLRISGGSSIFATSQDTCNVQLLVLMQRLLGVGGGGGGGIMPDTEITNY